LRRTIISGGVLFLLSAALWAMPSVAADPVRGDLNFGRADAALEKLNSALSLDPNDAEAHNLRCRVFYQEEHWDQAIAECEAAVQNAPSNSSFHLWLGRAYGQKAERVSLVTAFKLARRVAGGSAGSRKRTGPR